MKIVLIGEKPSVAREFASAIDLTNTVKEEGCIKGHSKWDGNDYIVTWAVGHLITMSYPEVYDEKYKKWNLLDLPFIPSDYKYEVIKAAAKQFKIVKKIYNDKSIDAIYYGPDPAREGWYIQSLIRRFAGHKAGIIEKVVWIDSQTKEEVQKGIKNARDIKEFSKLEEAGYMRAIEDYLIGINFSRALSCKYGKSFNESLKTDKWTPISVGRVMTCVLGMIVDRENEINNFKQTIYYKIEANMGEAEAEWKPVEGQSRMYNSDKLYQNTGFLNKTDADIFIDWLKKKSTQLMVEKVDKKGEKQYAPLLFNLAELQATCSKKYKISPDETLNIAQKLYESKLTTYPRTDARVLSSAIAKEIDKNIKGLSQGNYKKEVATYILEKELYKNIANTKYTDDKKVTDHYAIIPTGVTKDIDKLSEIEKEVYQLIVTRFLCIFYPAAEYEKIEITYLHPYNERFFISGKKLIKKGYLGLLNNDEENPDKEEKYIPDVKEGDIVDTLYGTKEGKTTPPKRYTSGSMILAMENAGNLIEDEELRAQIKGSGIGTSATRAEILKKLVSNKYISLNKKTQVYTPAEAGLKIYDIVKRAIPALLNPQMTASWEKGLSQIEQGIITKAQYIQKLNAFITQKVEFIKGN